MSRILRWLAIGVVVCMCASGLLAAQTASTAQMSGTVTDPSGAVLPGAEISATQTDTGVVRSAISNETGAYVLANLPIGPYRLEASLPGFRTYVQTGIVLQVGSNPVINVSLQVGQVAETVEVQANATLVETRVTGVGTVIENQRILELPLNGRQATELIMAAGAAVQTGGSPAWGMKTGITVAVAGGQSYGVAYALDGASHSNFYDATGMPLPFPDALQEFKVATGAQDAQQGVHSGAQVSGLTKSGTNEFHGNLFEFVRNGRFNARNFFATKRDSLKRNQFGGTVGGPIIKDKLFFFGGYQRTTIRQDPTDNTTFVPTPAMLSGDFTLFASRACQTTDVLLRGPFVNNRVTPAQLSPAAVKISQKLPQTSDPCGRILFGLAGVENDGQWIGRGDYQLTSKQTVFGRYLATKIHTGIPYDITQNLLTTNTPLGSPVNSYSQDDLATSVTVGHTYLLSPSTMNSFRASMNRIAGNHPGPSFFGPSDVGINAYSYLPHFMAVTVTGGPAIGQGTGADLYIYVTMLQGNDDVSIIRGSHQFSFGGHVANSLVDGLANVRSVGNYTFNGQITGLGMADFLTGNMFQFRQSAPNGLIENQRFLGLYAQDTWKATKRLTLNYGLRWEPFFPMQVKDGKIYNFSIDRFNQGITSTVYKNAPPGFYYPGDPGFNGKASIKKQWNTLEPRIGLAWDPKGDGRLAIRAGAGISYDFVNEQLHHNTTNVAPFSGDTIVPGPISMDNPWQTFPGGNPFPYSPDRSTARFTAGGSYGPVPPDIRSTEVYSWNLAVQRQFTRDWFASVSYVGSQAIHMWTLVELNPAIFLGTAPCTLNTATGPVTYPVCSTTGNTNQRRRLNLQNPIAAQNISYLTAFDDGATQNYHGLLLNTTIRAARNMNINANYTWSHCIGDATVGANVANPGANYPHMDNRRLDRGNCLGDRRHLLNFTVVGRTPQFANPTLRRVGTGWSLSGIYRYSTGQPLTIASGLDQALNGVSVGNIQRANQVSPNVFAANRGAACANASPCVTYLNIAAFAQPTVGTLGNLGVLNVAGPGFWQFDVALSRAFAVTERQKLEFRAEAFNVLNGVRFNNPAVVLSNPITFGQILSAQDPRIMQFALKYAF
jgi:Carboxypeptidase regulatory-like domain